MAHPVTIHPLVIVLDSCIPGQPLTLTISKFLSPNLLFSVHLVIESIELIGYIFQFLQNILHINL